MQHTSETPHCDTSVSQERVEIAEKGVLQNYSLLASVKNSHQFQLRKHLTQEFLSQRTFSSENVGLHVEALLSLAEKVINVILTH